MKPKPLSALNHFTVPVAIKSFIRRATSRPAAPTASLPVLGSVPDLGPGTKPQPPAARPPRPRRANAPAPSPRASAGPGRGVPQAGDGAVAPGRQPQGHRRVRAAWVNHLPLGPEQCRHGNLHSWAI